MCGARDTHFCRLLACLLCLRNVACAAATVHDFIWVEVFFLGEFVRNDEFVLPIAHYHKCVVRYGKQCRCERKCGEEKAIAAPSGSLPSCTFEHWLDSNVGKACLHTIYPSDMCHGMWGMWSAE